MIALPSTPGPRSVGWSLVDFGGVQQGALGGAAQRVNRLGARWRCEIELPAMTPDQARIWAAALSRGLREGVSYRVRQVSTPTGSPGTVLVAGAAQAGDALAVDGGTAGYVAKAGQWCSILSGGRRFLHQIAAPVMFSGSGTATLELEPPLRRIPADNAPVELAAPVIEGLLGTPPGWTIDAGRLVRGLTFTIEEIA
jgi:hypothetical protein